MTTASTEKNLDAGSGSGMTDWESLFRHARMSLSSFPTRTSPSFLRKQESRVVACSSLDAGSGPA